MAGALNGAEVRRIMADAGIPDTAITTTLVREGCQPIRDFVYGKGFVASVGYRGLFIYPNRPQHVAKARRVFHVAAKEMLLSGISAFVISLPRLVTALSEGEEGELDYYRVSGAGMVFITDFYERGAAFPLQGWQAGVVRSWIREKYENRGGVSFLSDAALPDNAPWWPASFLGYVGEHVVTFGVGA